MTISIHDDTLPKKAIWKWLRRVQGASSNLTVSGRLLALTCSIGGRVLHLWELLCITHEQI